MTPTLVNRPIFDAIVSDPPYGIKVSSRKAPVSNHTNTQNKGNFNKNEVYEKLIEVAAA